MSCLSYARLTDAHYTHFYYYKYSYGHLVIAYILSTLWRYLHFIISFWYSGCSCVTCSMILCMYHTTCHFVGLLIPHWYYAYVWAIYTLVSQAFKLGLCVPGWHDVYILGLFIPCFLTCLCVRVIFPLPEWSSCNSVIYTLYLTWLLVRAIFTLLAWCLYIRVIYILFFIRFTCWGYLYPVCACQETPHFLLCLYNIPMCTPCVCYSCVTHRCVNHCDHTHTLILTEGGGAGRGRLITYRR